MTIGLPGSGKSTWAKAQKNSVRINKDDLRSMLHDGEWSKKNEREIIAARNSLVALFLTSGRNVIVDDTNLSPKHKRDLQRLTLDISMSLEYPSVYADFEVKDFTHVPAQECIKRDLQRSRSVGKDVIMRMYNQYLKPMESQPVKPVYDPTLEDCIICDIDGTLAIMGDRSPYNDLEAYKDKPNEAVCSLVRQLIADGETVIFMSGRKEQSKQVTLDWLKTHDIPVKNGLFMRADGDNRKDSIIKLELYERHVAGKYNVRFVLDDRDQVVEMWRGHGLTCMQVAPGSF